MAMGPARRIIVLLAGLAAGSWALALHQSPPVLPGPDRSRADRATPARGGLLPYPGAESVVARRLVADAGLHYAPSPDGSRLSHQGSDGDLAVLHLHTGESRYLSGDSTVRGRPAGRLPIALGSRFSPGGERVAYEWMYEEGGTRVRAIRVVELGTGEIRQVRQVREPGFSDERFLRLGSWSPDGERIAVVVFTRGRAPADPAQIELVDVRDGSTTTIASFEDRGPASAVFSPDGRWLAYHRLRKESEEHDIFLRSVDGSAEIPLTRGPGDHLVAGWLPDGGPFFYLSGDRARFDLLAVELDDGRAVSSPGLVRPDLWRVSPLGFSRDAFFYRQQTQRVQPYTAEIDLNAGRLAGPLVPLFPASSPPRSTAVDWSPDGERMVYMEGGDLVVRSVGTGAERRIPTAFRVVQALEWSPVSDRVLVQCVETTDGTRGIFLVDLSTGAAELVERWSGMGRGQQPRWSVGGRAVLLARWVPGRPGHRAIVRFDLETREEAVVFTAGPEWNGFTGFAVHPSGRWLAVGQSRLGSGGGDRVILVPAAGGEPRELIRVHAPEGISIAPYGLEWTADGRRLIIASNPDAEYRSRRLWAVDLEGSELRELGSFPSGRTYGAWQVRPRLHAGGREISVIAGENRREVWTLENLRPARPGGGTVGP